MVDVVFKLPVNVRAPATPNIALPDKAKVPEETVALNKLAEPLSKVLPEKKVVPAVPVKLPAGLTFKRLVIVAFTPVLIVPLAKSP